MATPAENGRPASWTMHHGDCLEFLPNLPAASVDAVVTDPPYMLGAASARKSADKVLGWADINNASYWYASWLAECWRVLKQGGCLWTFANWRLLPVLQCAMSKVGGMSPLSVLVWDKGWPSVGSTRGLRQQYEIVVLAAKPDFSIPDRSLGDIWREKWTSHKPTGHPQEKPVPLLVRILNESAVPAGAVVLDPFAGSGSTGMACLQTGREFVGVELDATHHETARKRLAEVDGPLWNGTTVRPRVAAKPGLFDRLEG